MSGGQSLSSTSQLVKARCKLGFMSRTPYFHAWVLKRSSFGPAEMKSSPLYSPDRRASRSYLSYKWEKRKDVISKAWTVTKIFHFQTTLDRKQEVSATCPCLPTRLMGVGGDWLSRVKLLCGGRTQSERWLPEFAKSEPDSKHMLKHGAICPIISKMERVILSKIINCVLGFKLDPFCVLFC